MADNDIYELSARSESEGSVVFLTETKEALRLDPDGKVYVRGTEVGDDRQVYEAFVRWLTDCRCLECGGSMLGRAACAG